MSDRDNVEKKGYNHQRMKVSLLSVLGIIVICLFSSSCTTGYSKKTYISSLDKYITKIEENWKTYDAKDWVKVDERMEAFEQKFDKYAEDFTKEESKEVTRYMRRYYLVRVKAKGNEWAQDFNDWYDRNKEKIDDALELLNLFSD